jgi:hypothetical protein
VVAPLEMKEGTTSLGARAQSAIQRAAVLYKPRLATFKKKTFLSNVFMTRVHHNNRYEQATEIKAYFIRFITDVNRDISIQFNHNP